MVSQKDMFYRASREVAQVNEEFLWLVEHGLTREDLQQNLERRPSLWERFASWLDHLPSRSTSNTC